MYLLIMIFRPAENGTLTAHHWELHRKTHCPFTHTDFMLVIIVYQPVTCEVAH